MSKFKFGKKSSSGSVKDKFKKKSSDTLQRAWENRDKQSKLSSVGKSIFNEEMMEKYGITEIKYTKKGEYWFAVLPISHEEDVPYFEEVSIHGNVGIDNDSYLCMERYKEDGDCYRCTVQKHGWKKYDKSDPKIKSQLVAMYPNDRCIYLVYDLTDKLSKDEDVEPVIHLWNAPKKDSAHERLQDAVRNKKTGEIVDISDLGKDGKIVYMKVTIKEVKEGEGKKAGNYPQYGSFELIDRDDELPDELLEALDKIVSDAEEENMNAIQYLLHYPEEGEIEESMKTEIFESGEEDEPPVKSDKKKKTTFKKEKKVDLDELQEELEGMSKIKLKIWCKEKKLWDEIVDDSLEKDEMIETILEYYSKQ